MSQYDTVGGHGRHTIFTLAGSAITTGGSLDIGVYDVQKFSRLTGLFSTVGSLTFRLRSGVNSGTYEVSSSFAINSGGWVYDVPNYGRFAAFDITNAQSTVYTLLVLGEPMR